jgi:hypothetical protein
MPIAFVILQLLDSVLICMLSGGRCTALLLLVLLGHNDNAPGCLLLPVMLP